MELEDLRGNWYVMGAVAVMLLLITGVVVQGFGMSDSRQTENLAYAGDAAPASTEMDRGFSSGGAADVEERKTVTRSRIDIDVEDVRGSQDSIESMASDYRGYVLYTSLDRNLGDSGRMEVKVPEDNLSAFMTGIEDSWGVDSMNRNVDDVTQRYTELKLELENKRQEMERLQELMNRTDDVENLIKIQERMGELRTRIQYLENEFSRLEERTEYASVTITMEEATAFESRFELRQAFTDSYQGVFKSVNLMIVGAGYLLPFVVLFALLYFGKRRWG
ncbi:MAG: DUF4349 domain-containing protein [Candidatus Nanohaloarchaeota archaeon QJJ-7]|nr:DUF4349 domain-containing protein [Candidatus Nanohaloarchaeota archaeon QJJ-7]